MTDLEDLEAWFIRNGGFLHPRVEFARTPSEGYTLRVKEDQEDFDEENIAATALPPPQSTHESPVDRRKTNRRLNRLPPNTTVISCPHSLSLSALNASTASPFYPAFSPKSSTTSPGLPGELTRNARPQCVAALWLCIQYLLGVHSPWHGYIQALPQPPIATGSEVLSSENGRAIDIDLLERGDAYESFPERDVKRRKLEVREPHVIDTAMWWDGEQRAWIRGTNLLRGIEDLEDRWRKEWEQWHEVVGAWAAENGFIGLDWNLFKWAISIFGSRAFSSAVLSFVSHPLTGIPLIREHDPHGVLYPGVDILNHKPDTLNRWYCDAECLSIVCDDMPAPGEQVWNSYGKKSNSELLLSFGFCLEGNPFDDFAIKLSSTPVPLFELIDRMEASNSTIQKDPLTPMPGSLHPNEISARLPAATSPNDDSKIIGLKTHPTATFKLLSPSASDALVSHDPDEHVYYVRNPTDLNIVVAGGSASLEFKNGDESSKSLASKIEQPQISHSYPSPGVQNRWLHFSGIPMALLRRLAVLLANERESASATVAVNAAIANSSGITTKTECQLSSCLGMDLLELLGERNELAVSILLFSRLEMEGRRLEALRNAYYNNGKTRDVEEYSKNGKLSRRRDFAGIYLDGQLKIVSGAVAQLQRRVLHALTGIRLQGPKNRTLNAESPETAAESELESDAGIGIDKDAAAAAHVEVLRDLEDATGPKDTHHLSAQETQHGNEARTIPTLPHFLTLSMALACLRTCSPDAADEFLAGILCNGNPDNNKRTAAEHLDRIRAGKGERRRDEEDLLAFLLGALHIFLFHPQPGSNGEGAVQGFASASAAREVANIRRWHIWDRINTTEAAIGDGGAHSDDEDEAVAHVAIDMSLSTGRRERRKLRGGWLWGHERWRRGAFCRACVRTVMQETVSVALGPREFSVLQNFERAILGEEEYEAAAARVRQCMKGDEDGEKGEGVKSADSRDSEGTKKTTMVVALFVGGAQ